MLTIGSSVGYMGGHCTVLQPLWNSFNTSHNKSLRWGRGSGGYLRAFLKDFDPLTALRRFPFEHVTVVRFWWGCVFGQRRVIPILCKKQHVGLLRNTSTYVHSPTVFDCSWPRLHHELLLEGRNKALLIHITPISNIIPGKKDIIVGLKMHEPEIFLSTYNSHSLGLCNLLLSTEYGGMLLLISILYTARGLRCHLHSSQDK